MHKFRNPNLELNTICHSAEKLIESFFSILYLVFLVVVLVSTVLALNAGHSKNEGNEASQQAKKNIFKPFTLFFVVVSSIAAMLIIDFKTEKETKKKGSRAYNQCTKWN